MSQIIDGMPQFICRHEFIALPYGFVCHKCQHARTELELTGHKALLFFPLLAAPQNIAILAPPASLVPKNR
jgi:hypothetical protein